jgi:hypothetical protein
MWHVKEIRYYIVTNGVCSTDKQFTYFEDAQQELAEVLEGIEEITAHEKLVLPERLPIQN